MVLGSVYCTYVSSSALAPQRATSDRSVGGFARPSRATWLDHTMSRAAAAGSATAVTRGPFRVAELVSRRERPARHLPFRRRDFLAGLLATSTWHASGPAFAADLDATIARLRREAAEAYDAADFTRAYDALDALAKADPGNPAWVEGRAQVGVDAKHFASSVDDYSSLLASVDPVTDGGAAARFRAGRALAYEGLYAWPLALRDYDETLRLAEVGGFLPDPYVLNSRGNCRGSLGDWGGAREDYLESARLFQSSKGFRSGASTTQRLDGAVYAASNAALALAELGDDAGATVEAEKVSRRAPNSADMRAALAALYYADGRVAEAEEAWELACGRNVGCGRYRDLDYVRRVRRWPPAMVEKLDAFLSIR